MSKKILIVLSVIALLTVGLLAACGEEEEVVVEKESIVIGASRPITGANASIGDAAFGPTMELWEAQINDAGGIYLADYGKSLPIEYIIYDDATDVGTAVRLTEKLIVEDEVDLLFPSCGTAFISAQAPIANKYEMVFLTAEGGATTMKETIPAMPYVFVNLSFSDWYQLPVLADMLAAEGAETAYVVSIADLHGIEYSGVAATEFSRVGIDIVGNVSVPITHEDFEPIIKAAMDADPDVFCVFAYPPIVLPCTAVSMALGFNPDCFVAGPGANFGFYQYSFGDDIHVVDGVTVFAVANRATSPAMATLFDELEALVGPAMLDWWGQPLYAAVVQIWEQALGETGTLDQAILRDYFATATFDTLLGPTYYEMFGDGGGFLAWESHPGEIGQWQDGICEIVGGAGPNFVQTAEFQYPKQPWPTAE